MRNAGGRAVNLDGTARLTGGPGGTRAGPYPAHQVVTIAPGQSYPVSFLPGPQPARRALARPHQPGERVHQAHRLRDHPFLPATVGRWAGWTVLAWIAGLLAAALAAARFALRRTRRARTVVRTPSA